MERKEVEKNMRKQGREGMRMGEKGAIRRRGTRKDGGGRGGIMGGQREREGKGIQRAIRRKWKRARAVGGTRVWMSRRVGGRRK